MKAPSAPKKRNITFRYDITSSLSAAGVPSVPIPTRQKKLRRLPHIFSRVLELPFRSEANVLVQENHEFFRFVTGTNLVSEDVRAQLIEIIPGVTKIVIRGSNMLDLSLDELELDLWRFRLPPCAQPELASAAYVDGKLIVTIPKGPSSDDDDGSDNIDIETGQNGENSGNDTNPNLPNTRSQGSLDRGGGLNDGFGGEQGSGFDSEIGGLNDGLGGEQGTGFDLERGGLNDGLGGEQGNGFDSSNWPGSLASNQSSVSRPQALGGHLVLVQ
ncbi:hypothetical protein AMTRI_Chr03g55510 [Amborella trichopoda]|uniref:SHSP domain-containing protein n=1 Tax=Amborella trichopoda TaxID=13333 RepID=W1NEA2_AMBTC|nr:uncharacterized protein LOC18421397 [Amborella trichopoda]XP_011621167.1 uncharacterized protein LOC18421397 [Amborella trichopoda]XP_011621201.1 uncharacterized protein LOC18421397 [Amborella trichopoda]XP_011621227.1 uncharacterized protein LOC18421397 [Amborella trichopoda]XP_020517446.1 uncharacterized protein LOC18421397 [Amborella trichopoda]XP_020517448.1 uncharacterized protein LOC18421397 [Amborella trichopoda]ERM93495.1 hypothetical protein AMTR_s00004p00027710 [Amborella trichop|eukprot:XP_011621112.1 uncharacterized protein LOC18421397 [Amborella trichopoda]